MKHVLPIFFVAINKSVVCYTTINFTQIKKSRSFEQCKLNEPTSKLKEKDFDGSKRTLMWHIFLQIYNIDN